MDGKTGGRLPQIPIETQEAMREMRSAGKTIKEIADFYHVSQNSVLKYTGRASDVPDSAGASLSETDTDVENLVLGQHAKRVLNLSKKIDADTVHAGEALREYFKNKGLDVDLRKIPTDQLIKLVKSPGVYDDMSPDVKNIFSEWLTEKLTKGEPVTEKLDGKISFADVKELLMLRFLVKMSGDDGSSSHNPDIIAEMRAENEKQRQFYEKKIEDMEKRMQDIVLEKRFQTIEDRHISLGETLQSRLDEISTKIEDNKNVALTGSPGEKLDAISHIEQLAAERERVNKALEKLNQPQVMTNAPAVPGIPDTYKNPDGSTDLIRYAGDKLESTVKMITEAVSKKTPDRKPVCDTPAPGPRLLSFAEAENTYQHLLLKPFRTPEESAWIIQYLPVRARYIPPAQPRETPAAGNVVPGSGVPSGDPAASTAVEQPAEPPAEQPAKPELNLNEEIYRDSKRNLQGAEQPARPEPDLIEQLKHDEERQAKSLEGVF